MSRAVVIWAVRLVLGATFILSGWAKCVDLWGFVYKIEDYLAVWGLATMVPREFTLVGAGALSIFEFITGLLLATGSLRRASAWMAAAIMAVMLPLSVYIYVANPVADCGCFGDLLVISNGTTLAKNIVLSALSVFLLLHNRQAPYLYRPGLQSLVIALGLVYALTVSILGWTVQPVVDFRPFPVGTDLTVEDTDADVDVKFIYTKDGREQTFSLDALPDSTWEYVGRAEAEADVAEHPAFFDDEGYDMAEDIFVTPGDVILLTVPEPDYDYLMRARFANEVHNYAREHGIRMAAVVAASGEALERWKSLARPQFEVYSSADTGLKQLVRGTMGLVLIRDGRIVQKRNFSNISPDILQHPKALESLHNVGDGRVAAWLTGSLAAGLLILWLIGRVGRRAKN